MRGLLLASVVCWRMAVSMLFIGLEAMITLSRLSGLGAILPD